MRIKLSAKTDIGKERDQNEDAFVVCPDLSHPDWKKDKDSLELGTFGTLLVVADGMGGANAGEVASRLSIESIQNAFNSTDITSIIASEEKIKAFLQDAIKTADKYLNEHMVEHPETIGMGTTLVVCWILKDHAYIAWCGDSRCYVFNPQSGLKALTKDHSYVQELIDKGELTEESALTHPDSNLITRGLGDFDTPAEADIVTHTLLPNDMFLLCSDGLCGYCTNHTIENVIKTYYDDTDECCDKLMELALDTGGYDNICIALAKVYDKDKHQPHKPKQSRFFSNLFSNKQA
jgi:protein phosphatase